LRKIPGYTTQGCVASWSQSFLIIANIHLTQHLGSLGKQQKLTLLPFSKLRIWIMSLTLQQLLTIPTLHSFAAHT
jgi:hypothetical protein